MMTENAVTFPAGVDGVRILKPLNDPRCHTRGPAGSTYRRELTRTSPTRFALIYLSPYLRQQETGVLSFAAFHLDMAREARSWMPDARGVPHPRRDIWVAPRRTAKSVWGYLILPLWALAHGHRRFFLSFSATAAQAATQLGHLRRQLDENKLLLYDFSELAIGTWRGARNARQAVTMSGATLAAAGMGENTLGTRSNGLRPDLITGDDLEPVEADYPPGLQAKQLSRLVQGILPMGARSTVVQIYGTVTKFDSLIHQAVQHALQEKSAPWIVENGFTCHYYDAIVTDENGVRRSMWPEWKSLTELEAEEGTRTYALNMRNNPTSEDVQLTKYWSDALFKYRPSWKTGERVLSIDVAVTRKSTSDYTALAVVGTDETCERFVVEHTEAGRISGHQIRERIWKWAERYPRTLNLVILESNQGGEVWADILSPMPVGVRLMLYSATKNKRARTMVMLDEYEKGSVWHHRPLPEFERQLKEWPNGKHDDLIDAASAGLRWAREEAVPIRERTGSRR